MANPYTLKRLCHQLRAWRQVFSVKWPGQLWSKIEDRMVRLLTQSRMIQDDIHLKRGLLHSEHNAQGSSTFEIEDKGLVSSFWTTYVLVTSKGQGTRNQCADTLSFYMRTCACRWHTMQQFRCDMASDQETGRDYEEVVESSATLSRCPMEKCVPTQLAMTEL